MRCHERDFNTRKSTLSSLSRNHMYRTGVWICTYIDQEAAADWIKNVVPAFDVCLGVCLRDRFLIFNNAFAERAVVWMLTPHVMHVSDRSRWDGLIMKISCQCFSRSPWVWLSIYWSARSQITNTFYFCMGWPLFSTRIHKRISLVLASAGHSRAIFYPPPQPQPPTALYFTLLCTDLQILRAAPVESHAYAFWYTLWLHKITRDREERLLVKSTTLLLRSE